jgi:predicted nucleic acid-binding protein
MRILVDSNLILRLAQPAHQHHQIARAALENVRIRSDDLCIVPQALYEFWVVATRPATEKNSGLGMTGEEAQREVLAILKLFTFLDDEPGVFDEWHRLVAQYDVRGKKAHDARFVAAMRRRGITHLLTFNTTDFRRYSEITILSPTDVAQNPPSN